MTETVNRPKEVRPQDLFEISRLVAEAPEWKPALDKVSGLVRSIFIFDNLAVFIADDQNHLEVMYARAMGRGRKSEADIAWGESITTQVIEKRKTILQKPPDTETERLRRPFLLAAPMCAGTEVLGALIYVRFGGPEFSASDIQLGEFIANQIALLVERQKLQQKYASLEIKHMQSQLQEDFISTLTHELRNPLGFIKGYATTLLRADTTWDHETQQQFLQIIDQETDHLQELIENLLDSARLQSGMMDMKFHPVRLDALMNDVIMRARLQHTDLVINLSVSSYLPPIQASPRRISQVFENLLSNAVKYAPGSPVDINIHQEADWIKIEVRDHGPGIPEKYLASLFTRFFRNPDQPPGIHGTGLGLNICKQIIQAHNGMIYATSTLGDGMVFHIQLPYKPADKPVA